MAGALRGDHRDVDVGRRLDELEPDVEAVPEEQRLAGGQVRRDRLGVDLALRGVRREHHDHVGLGGRLGRRDAPAGPAPRPWPGSSSPPAGRPRTSTPESRSDSAWAWPWLPYPMHGDLAALDDATGRRRRRRTPRRSLRSLSSMSGRPAWPVMTRVTRRRSRRAARAAVIEREPRPMATRPDCTISLMPYGSRSRSSASSLSGVPVASMVSVSGATSTTLARNSSTVSSTCDCAAPGRRAP